MNFCLICRQRAEIRKTSGTERCMYEDRQTGAVVTATHLTLLHTPLVVCGFNYLLSRLRTKQPAAPNRPSRLTGSLPPSFGPPFSHSESISIEMIAAY